MEKKFRIRGEIYLLLSGFFFGLQPFFAKIIYAHGGDAYSLLVLRFFVRGIVFAIISMLIGTGMKLSKDEFLSVLILSVPETVMCILLFVSSRFSLGPAFFPVQGTEDYSDLFRFG